MFMKVGRVALAGLLTLGLASCSGGSGGDDNKRQVQDYGKPTIDPSEGDIAIFGNLSKDAPVSTYFGKRYDRMDLDAVLKASGFSTIDYARRQQIEVYRVPRPDNAKAAIYFTSLSYPPSELDSLWKDVSGGTTQGVLAGLYFDAACIFQNRCSEPAPVRPIILVDESGDRWTLVHEMMHHAFNSQRKKDRTPDIVMYGDMISQSVTVVSGALDRYDNTKSYPELKAATDEMENLAKLVYGRLSVKELEETAVERLLLDEWKAGRFLHVPKDSVANAVWYMNVGRTNSIKLIEQLMPIAQQIENEAYVNNYTDIRKQAREIMDFLSQIRSTTKQLVLEAERMAGVRLKDGEILPRVGQAGHTVMPHPTHRDCVSDTADLERISGEIDRVAKAAGL